VKFIRRFVINTAVTSLLSKLTIIDLIVHSAETRNLPLHCLEYVRYLFRFAIAPLGPGSEISLYWLLVDTTSDMSLDENVKGV